MAEEEVKNSMEWPKEATEASDFDYMMVGKNDDPIMKIKKEKLNEIIVVQGESMSAIQGGATASAAVALPAGPTGQNRWFDASWGYWKYNNVVLKNPLGTDGIPQGNDGTLYWDGTGLTWKISKIQVLPAATANGQIAVGDQNAVAGDKITRNVSKLESGKNKFNKATVQLDKQLNTVGVVVDDASLVYAVSDLIPVDASNSYFFSAIRRVTQYDSSGAFIAGSYYDSPTIRDFSVTTVATASYIRFMTLKSSVNIAQVEKGSVKTSYEAYKLLSKKRLFDEVDMEFQPIVDSTVVDKIFQEPKTNENLDKISGLFKTKKLGKQLFNVAKATGATISSTGAIVADSSGSWFTSEKIEVGSLTPLYISRARFICEYDAAGVAILSTYQDLATQVSKLLTTSATTKYIAVTFQSTVVSTSIIAKSTAAVAYEPYNESISVGDTKQGGEARFKPLLDESTTAEMGSNQLLVDAFKQFNLKNKSKQLFNKASRNVNQVIANGGQLIFSSGWDTSDYIDVGANTDVFFNKVRLIAEYDANKAFIPGTWKDLTSQPQYFLKTNPNTRYTRATTLATLVDTFMIALSTVAVPYEDFSYDKAVDHTKAGESVFFQPLITDEFIQLLQDKLNLSGMNDLAKFNISNYPLQFETKDFKAYITKDAVNVIEAVYGTIAVKKLSDTSFQVSTNGIDGSYGTAINLDAATFPNLISGAIIHKIIVLGWQRNAGDNRVPSTGWRLNVITNTGQIYHNFPNRTPGSGTPDGTAQTGDDRRFDESVVWDIEGRRFPHMTDDSFPYMKNPALPIATLYEQHPPLNNDNGYGHGGFGPSITWGAKSYARYYFGDRSVSQQNSFFFMNGFDQNNKLAMIGTYRDNSSRDTRISAFASSDGGRTWYCKLDFANRTKYNVNDISLNTTAISGTYNSNDFKLVKRDLNIPNDANKEPSNLFVLGSEINITSISKENKCKVTTASAHGLDNSSAIWIRGSVVNGFEWLVNNEGSATSGGNGKTWKVEVIDSTSFYLHEFIYNPFYNVPARHIHAINRCKDGFMIGTGERYPEGWHYYLRTPTPETFESNSQAYNDFPLTRLTSSPNAIQRTLGTILLDDADQTIIFAADDGYIPVGGGELPVGRTGKIDRLSNGVWKGKLTDIDDMSKFVCIYEAQEVAYSLNLTRDGLLVFAGQQGEIAVSADMGETWRSFRGTEGYPMQYPKGEDSKNRFVLDKMVIYRVS